MRPFNPFPLRFRPRSLLLRGLPLLVCLAVWWVVPIGKALASDCPPDDPSRSDCQAAANTARNPLVPLAGGAGGAVAGELIGRVTKKGKEKGESTPPDEAPARENPCLGAFEGLQLAKLNQEMLFEGYLSWKNTVQALDELYWKTNKAGFWGGVVDVGFLAGSVFGRPLAAGSKALIAKKFLSDTLRQKLLEAALKSMLKGSLKDMSKYFDPAKLPGKLTEDVGKKYLQEMLKEQITTRIMQDYLRDGAIRAGGFDGATVKFMENVNNYSKFRDIVSKSYADHWANFLGDTLSLYSTGMDALTTKEQLEIIRMRLQAARQSLFNVESQLQLANAEMDRTRDAYNACAQSQAYQQYLRYLEFLKLPRQG